MAMAPKRSAAGRASSLNKPKSRESAGSSPTAFDKLERDEKDDKDLEKGEKKDKAEKGDKSDKSDKSDKTANAQTTSMNFPFRPPTLPPPPDFAGCFCPGDICTCRYESLQYITPEGLFAPFAPPTVVGPPRVCVWEHLTREDLKELEMGNFSRDAAFEIFKRRFTVPTERGEEMLWELLYEALRFCRIHSFTNKQSSALVSIFYITHVYYVSSLWRLPEDTYAYFKECILLHTVQRPPKSAEIFEPGQSQIALKHFVSMYLRHLPLVHVACLPLARLQLIWPMRYDRKTLNAEKKRGVFEAVAGKLKGTRGSPSDWPTSTASDADIPVERVRLQLRYVPSYRPTTSVAPVPSDTKGSVEISSGAQRCSSAVYCHPLN